MKRVAFVFTALLSALLARSAFAQEPGAPVSEGPVAQAAGRLSGPIDFWGKGPAMAKGNALGPAGLEIGPSHLMIRETVWAQPVRTPDGNWMLYVPPKPILDFLERPTDETAKAYVTWKAEQAEKLGRAMALLARVKASGPAPVKEEGPHQAADPQAGPATLVYFKKPSCPHCVSQDGVLTQWLPKHPDLHLDVVLPEERPELWKSYGVRGTPTLVLRPGEGKEEVLVGLQTESQLEAALKRLALPARSSSNGDGKEHSQ